jgi:hypothetical protein
VAVIRRSESELRDLLARKYDPNGSVHYLGSGYPLEVYPPLLLSLDWHQGMRILMDAGANPFLAMQDALRDGLEDAIKILLEYDCPLSLGIRRSQMPIISTVINANAKRVQFSTMILVIRKLRDQRMRLWELALEKLCETEIAALGIRLGEGEILDEGASGLCQALVEKGVKVPPAIMVSRITPNSAFRAKLFSSGLDLVQALFDVGFRSMEALESPSQMLELKRTLRGQPCYDILPLLHQSCLALNPDMATWCLEHGCRPVVEVHGTIHFASHTLAAGFSTRWRFSAGDKVFGMLEKSGLIPRLLSLEGEYGKDQCICYCSLNGCSAITVLANCLMEERDPEIGCNWPKKRGIVHDWLKLSQGSTSVSADRWEDFFRVEIFHRLGMAHTCCKSQYDWYPGTRLSREERDELRDEDEKTGHVEELNKWIHDYRNEQLAFDGPKDSFWKLWFKKLKDKDHDLHVNETHRERWESQKARYLRVLPYHSNGLATGELERNPDWERDYDPDDYYKCECEDTCMCFKEE